MASKSKQPFSIPGICDGLPVISPIYAGLKAIVVGASGMSGQCMIDVLTQSPQRWGKIYAMSRRPPQTQSPNVQHVPLDLTKDPEEMAKTFKEHGVEADVVFFFGYISLSPKERNYSAGSKEAAQKLSDINAQILRSFLAALDLASITPKRILLQTGLKNYGGHLGPVNVPCIESAPRVEVAGIPNFYYAQEDILFAHCSSHPSTSYNVTMPSWILGAVRASDMTTFFPLAVYASIQKHLNRALEFPGDWAAWDKLMPMSSGTLNSYFHEYLVVNDSAANERFNIVDDSDFTWGMAWPIIAGWVGMEWRGPMEEVEGVYEVVEMPHRPRGAGPKGRCTSTFSLPTWAKSPDVQRAWTDLKATHHLTSDPLATGSAEGMWASLQFSLTMSWSWATSMDKARKFGWLGHVDTMESMREVFECFVGEGMIPPFR